MLNQKIKLFQIELTNHCNFSCNYCPRTEHMTREVGQMSVETIERIASVCNSEWIRIHHYGENLLYPKLTKTAIEIFKRHGFRVGLNSNGSAGTLKNVRMVMDAGLDELIFSWHPLSARRDPGEARSDLHYQTLIDNLTPDQLKRCQVIRIVDDSEIPEAIADMTPYRDQGMPCMIKRKRNLGQVWGVTGESNRPEMCSFLDDPEFAVLWDGTIVPCCETYDRRPGWILGNIWDETLPVKNPGCSLCKGCTGYGGNSFETEKVIF